MDAVKSAEPALARHGASIDRRLRKLAARALVAAWWACYAVGASAQSAPTVEDVEAAYLQKFIGYIDWPAKAFTSATAPVVIGVAGSDHMAELLAAAASTRSAQGRQIEIRRLSKPQEAPRAHLVFVGKAAWPDLPAWADAATGNAVVVATDAPGGIEEGAALAFVQVGARVRFEASLPAAQRAGVKISARMLAVAERVVANPP